MIDWQRHEKDRALVERLRSKEGYDQAWALVRWHLNFRRSTTVNLLAIGIILILRAVA